MTKQWADYNFEAKFRSDNAIVVGMDEVGRGAFAGPLVIGAVILNKDFNEPVCDSKLISRKQRAKITKQIQDNAMWSATVSITPSRIDEQGLASALRYGFNKILTKIPYAIDLVLLDGNINYVTKYSCHAVVGGDRLLPSVAAASILAKHTRDKYMRKLANSYPQYGFNTNVGYGTKQHRLAIKQHGLCAHHRRSFNIAT